MLHLLTFCCIKEKKTLSAIKNSTLWFVSNYQTNMKMAPVNKHFADLETSGVDGGNIEHRQKHRCIQNNYHQCCFLLHIVEKINQNQRVFKAKSIKSVNCK